MNEDTADFIEPSPEDAEPCGLVMTQADNRPESLRKNICWSFAGNIVNAGCQWGIVAVLAKLGSAAMVGGYSWAQAVVTPIVVGLMLHLRPILVTDTGNERRFGDYLGLRLATMSLSLLAVSCYALWAASSWAMYLVVLFVALSKAIDGVGDLYRAYFQKHEKMELVSSNLMLRGSAALAAVAVTIELSGNLAASIAALCGVWLLISIFHDVPHARELAERKGENSEMAARLGWNTVKLILPAAIPMGAVMALVCLQSSIPRLFLNTWGGESAVGYFSAAYYPIITGSLVIGALGESALPRMNRLAFSDRQGLLSLLIKIEGIAIVTGLLLVLGVIAFGRPLLEIAYAPSFGNYYYEFVILAVGGLLSFLTNVLGYALTAARQFYVQPLTAFVACAVSAGTCALLVPALGVGGAAYAQLITSATALLASAACFWRAYRLMPLLEEESKAPEFSFGGER